MLKRLLSVLCTCGALCTIILASSSSVNAEEIGVTNILVDDSYLTYDDYSHGSSSNHLLRGEYLMDGDSIIAKTGNGKIYTYGATTANHDVDFVSVIVYVDRYHEDTDGWGQIHGRVEDARDTYYVTSAKTLKVDRGYYYRVRCEHFAGNDDAKPYDEDVSFTNGIWIP